MTLIQLREIVLYIYNRNLSEVNERIQFIVVITDDFIISRRFWAWLIPKDEKGTWWPRSQVRVVKPTWRWCSPRYRATRWNVWATTSCGCGSTRMGSCEPSTRNSAFSVWLPERPSPPTRWPWTRYLRIPYSPTWRWLVTVASTGRAWKSPQQEWPLLTGSASLGLPARHLPLIRIPGELTVDFYKFQGFSSFVKLAC